MQCRFSFNGVRLAHRAVLLASKRHAKIGLAQRLPHGKPRILLSFPQLVFAVPYFTLSLLFHRARTEIASAFVSHVVIYLMLYRKVRLLHPGRSCGTPRFSAPLAAKSFRPRSLRTRSCNFFVFCPFRTLPFSVHFFFHLNFLLSNGLRTLLQKYGGVGGCFPIRNSASIAAVFVLRLLASLALCRLLLREYHSPLASLSASLRSAA